MSDQHSKDFSGETWLAGLRDHLELEHYAGETIRRCVAVARDFLASLEKEHVELGAAQPEDVERYLQQARRTYHRHHGHSPDYRSWRYIRTSAIHMLLRLVQGNWPPPTVATSPAEILQEKICREYAKWMADMRGLAQQTVSDCCVEAHCFLDWLGERTTRQKLATLTLLDVDAYMKHRAGSHRRRSLNSLASRVRSFLRWLHMAEHTIRDLSSSVITPSLHAFEGIPSALRPEDVKKVLTAARQDCTSKGIRDYAILMVLSTYGVRASEITALRLDDVDWRKDTIRIRHSKTDATSYLPLLPEVGEALLQYLQKSRPKTPFREIFIRCHAPYRPFKDGSSLYGLVQCRLEGAAVVPPGKRGPHAFRHARAVSMLRGRVPLKEIGDLLGHRAADSTSVYLKLATEDLRAVALEIPAGVNV